MGRRKCETVQKISCATMLKTNGKDGPLPGRFELAPKSWTGLILGG